MGAQMYKLNCVALSGVLAASILLAGCDRPRDEPVTPKPNMLEREKLTYGDPSVQEQTLTYGGPTETRSQAEYSAQMENEVTDEPFGGGSGSNEEVAAGSQELAEGSRLW